jgi:haloalkane dehalogenase
MAGAMKLLRSVNARTLAGLEEVHAKIRVPVQLVWGTDDPWFPLAKARPMLTQFGGPATLVEIPGGKLLAHEDHGAEFALHAKGFFEACFRGDGPARTS